MAILYEIWRQVARENAEALALVDTVAGRRWTFRELAAEAESFPGGTGWVFPDTSDFRFVLTLLAAWRDQRPVCPLEPGQPRPQLSGTPPLGTVHLKQTSATAGPARGVAFSAGQLSADCRNIIQTMGLRHDWPNLGVISLAHSYGFSNLVLPLLLGGVPLILAGSALPEGLRQAAKGWPALTLAGVPALWRAWHQAHAIPPQVQLAISAGAPLPLALETTVLSEHGLKIHNFYGSTETGGIAYDGTFIARRDPACVGIPITGVGVCIGTDGCVEVRGDAVGISYWPERTGALANGVFRTGDVGELTAGELHLRGRFSDLINVAGRKIAPEQIEQALLQHPGVSECVVFGVPCPEERRGEIIVAYVAPRPGLALSDLRSFAAHRLPDWQVPREWVFSEELVASRRGKLSRAHWRRHYREGGTGS